VTEYLDAAHEAYRRLKWAEENRPPPEKMEEWRKSQARDARRDKINRLRSKVA
jgi:predicted Holliday junction resolvase-like endonuclease